jgi:SAM-dependent methyltransferase
MNPVYANLGCGSRFHHDWLNFDLNATAPGVISCNLLSGVPLPDSHCDAVFNSALLEHLPPDLTAGFLQECRRILKPGGILRIGIPDLERIARVYLEKLDQCLEGDPRAESDYDWMMLEMIDQMIRTQPGGAMAEFIKVGAPNEDFIERRIGQEFIGLKKAFQSSGEGTWQRLQKLPPQVRRHKIKQRLLGIPGACRRALAGLLLSHEERSALKMGRFRLSGEVHLWMYDRFSLPRLLTKNGFTAPRIMLAGESSIQKWPSFGLDLDENCKPLKPDLLYVECHK